MGALLACRGGWRSIAGTEVPAQGAGSGGAYSIPGVPDSKPPNFHRVGQNQGSYEEVQRFVYMGEGQGRFHANDLERQGARDESPSGPSRIDLARLFYVFIMVFFVLAGVICVGISLTSEHSHEDRSMAAATDGPLVASEDAAQATAVASAPVVAASTAAESTLAPTYAGYGVPQTEITNGDAADDCVQSQGVAWSKEQSVRCCAEKGVGCPELDCDAGLSHWEKEWSEGKKEWCCSQGSSAGCGGDGGRQAVFRFVGFGDAREARRACKYSAGVAMPKSQGEVDEFKRMLDEARRVGNLTDRWPRNTVWLGGSWDFESKKWQWDDGTDIGKHWAAKNHLDHLGRSGTLQRRDKKEREPWLCTEVMSGPWPAGQWQDSHARHEFGIVCQEWLEATTTRTMVTTTSATDVSLTTGTLVTRPKPFDCRQFRLHWKRAWTDEKKDYCCRTEDHPAVHEAACMRGLVPREEAVVLRGRGLGLPRHLRGRRPVAALALRLQRRLRELAHGMVS